MGESRHKPGGGHWRRGTGYIHGILTTYVEGGSLSSGWVPGEGTQPSKNHRYFHVSALESEGCNLTGGLGAATTV